MTVGMRAARTLAAALSHDPAFWDPSCGPLSARSGGTLRAGQWPQWVDAGWSLRGGLETVRILNLVSKSGPSAGVRFGHSFAVFRSRPRMAVLLEHRSTYRCGPAVIREVLRVADRPQTQRDHSAVVSEASPSDWKSAAQDRVVASAASPGAPDVLGRRARCLCPGPRRHDRREVSRCDVCRLQW